ncbi:MAG: 3-oxoacyl-ACP synthase [Candidatus Cloacimonadota bacterium]|nr:MAG: 3-oxoacyl-ACP synthase [Candidatus Cloacimonadota bacterium]
MKKRRVAITSNAYITALGNNFTEFSENIEKNDYQFKTFKDTPILPIENFNLKDYVKRCKDARYLNRGAKLGFAAAAECIKKSGFTELPDNCAVFIGAGPNLDITESFPEINNAVFGTDGLQALWILKFLPNTLGACIAKQFDLHGENRTVTSACAASLHAVASAYREIKNNGADIILTGGGDSRLNLGGITAYNKASALFKGENPDKNYASFSNQRFGFIPGEGGGFLLLEELESAKKRNAKILAEIVGCGFTADGYSMTDPRPDGKFAAEAVKNALMEADLKPEEIDLIHAHGTGTLKNDETEAKVIKQIFGKSSPPVTALKSWTGHLSAACGAMETAVMIDFMNNCKIPAVRNLVHSLDEEIDFAKKSRKAALNRILLENFGFGGQNCALIIKKY